jgi:SpoVK/Ycf46/Vps4 family AAA+-type ATPase
VECQGTVPNIFQVSSSELRIDPKKIEEQLTNIFRQAHRWNAVLLLDEADVFLRKRSLHRADDDITSFLRKLEYNQGIIFLTTNRLEDFDPAMQSRIHLALFYPPLGPKTREKIWKNFLGKAATDKGDAKVKQKELDCLAENEINGRQVGYAYSDPFRLSNQS